MNKEYFEKREQFIKKFKKETDTHLSNPNFALNKVFAQITQKNAEIARLKEELKVARWKI